MMCVPGLPKIPGTSLVKVPLTPDPTHFWSSVPGLPPFLLPCTQHREAGVGKAQGDPLSKDGSS
jgi:hypothetical protein